MERRGKSHNLKIKRFLLLAIKIDFGFESNSYQPINLPILGDTLMAIIGVMAAAVILVLAILFYLANGARIPNARSPVAENPKEAHQHRAHGLNSSE
jgi:hypothetical protein